MDGPSRSRLVSRSCATAGPGGIRSGPVGELQGAPSVLGPPPDQDERGGEGDDLEDPLKLLGGPGRLGLLGQGRITHQDPEADDPAIETKFVRQLDGGRIG